MKTIIRPLVKYIVPILALTLIAAVLAGWEREKVYESRARLLFKLGDEFLQSDIGQSSRNNGRIMLAEAMNTDVQILTSHDQYLKVVDELGVNSFGGSDASDDSFTRDDAVEVMRGGLNVKSVENSAIIHLTYEHTDPERAKLVLAQLIEVYFRERQKLLRTQNVDVLASLRTETQERFEAARTRQETYLAGASIRDIEATMGISREQLMSLRADTRATRRQLAEDRQQLTVIDGEISKQPARKEIYSESQVNSALERARSRLVELQVEEKQLLGKFTPTSRPVTRVKSEISELQRIIRSEEGAASRDLQRTGNNPIRDSLELQRSELTISTAGAEVRLKSLEEQEAELQADLQALERRFGEAGKLADELALLERRYLDVDEQYLEQKILADTDAAREANVRVVESPAVPRTAAGLSMFTRFTLGALIGFFIGWIIAVWVELFRSGKAGTTGMPGMYRDGFGNGSRGRLVYLHDSPMALSDVQQNAQPAGEPPILGELSGVRR